MYVREIVSAVIGLTALIEGAFGASVLTIGSYTLTAGALGGALVGIGASAALYALSASRKPRSSVLEKQQSKFNERQDIPSVRVLVGKTRHGGALAFEETKAPYIYLVFLCSEGECGGASGMWIGENEVSLPDIVENTIMTPFATASGPDYKNNLIVSFGNGSAGQSAEPITAAGFANLGSGFRQQGIYRIAIRAKYGANADAYTKLWGQVQRPNPIWLSKGIFIYDPRNPLHDIDDASTHEWSDNPTLHIYHYARSQYGGRLDPAIYDWDIEKVKESADWDDDFVGTKSGELIKRYSCNGMYTLSDSPQRVMSDLMSSNRSRLIERGGKIWISSAKPKSPVATIHDGILVGGFEWDSSSPKRDTYNCAQTRFSANDREYEVVDGPLYRNSAWVSDDGETLTKSIELPFTDDHRIAQRIAKASVAESRLGKRVSCRVLIELLAIASDELVDSAVNISSNLWPMMNGKYIVSEMTISNATTIDLVLEEYDETIETDFVPETDEQDFTLEPLDIS